MFTGIINHSGTIASLEKSGDWLITIHVPNFTHNLVMGASVACNGACLTVIRKDETGFTVQVSQETLDKTTLGSWEVARKINLEPAMKLGDELGGHLVSGHVDALATLIETGQIADSWKLVFEAPPALSRFIAAKGSVTLDGVSLTVNSVQGNQFSVNIIPHTFQNTTLGTLQTGDKVNLEIDLIARYLARLMEQTYV